MAIPVKLKKIWFQSLLNKNEKNNKINRKAVAAHAEDKDQAEATGAVNINDAAALVATASALQFEEMGEDQLLIQLSTNLDAALTSETRGDGDAAVAKTAAEAVKAAAEAKARADAEAAERKAAEDAKKAEKVEHAVAQQIHWTLSG